MTQHRGVWFPDGIGDRWMHAFKHVKSVRWSMDHCPQHRTAIQAGGNVGLWPSALAARFARVITFEPDALTRACLERNVPASVDVRAAALGATPGRCGMHRKGLGSHRVIEGADVEVLAIDALGLTDLDFLQLDIEGYEWHALQGAIETIRRCQPLIQVELRNYSEKYGYGDEAIRSLMADCGYQAVSRQQGSDVVFAPMGHA